MGEPPKTFDEGLPKYVQAIRMAMQEGDITTARQATADLRAFILTLPTASGISKHLRIEYAERRATQAGEILPPPLPKDTQTLVW